MKIAITGPHGTGKSTLLKALQEDKDFSDYQFHSGLTRSLAEQNIPINEQGDSYTQISVMHEHYKRANLPGKHVYDRCVIDGLIYSTVLLDDLDLNDSVYYVIVGYYHECIKKYDHIFYILPEFPLEDDGIRTINLDFHKEITNEFITYIDEFSDVINLHRVTGSVEARVQQIKNIIK